MLIMETIAKIRRLYHAEHQGVKTIARTLKLSKNTVRKIIRSDETIVCYERKEPGHRVLGPYIESLTEKLTQDRQEPKRRHRTAKKLFLELQEQGYPGSYDAVHAFVRDWRQHHHVALPRAFIPLSFEPGEAFQFDWSTEEVEVGGVLTRLKVAHIRLCYSRYFLLVAYPNEQLEMVLDAHNQAFPFLGGYCRKGIYDNMKTAVLTIGVGKERDYHPRFKRMCCHHLFEPIACTPAAGWEKGQVENQVSTGRRNFFSPLIKVKDWDALNALLKQRCEAWAQVTPHPIYKEKTVAQVHQEELTYLVAYRGDFDAYKEEPVVVSPYSCIQFATNQYSVDCQYVGQAVTVRVYPKVIEVVSGHQRIGYHPRCFDRYQRFYNPWHYVPLLERKPGGLRNGEPFKQLTLPPALDKMRTQLQQYADGDKQFIRILLLVTSEGLEAVERACATALSQGLGNDTGVLRCLQPPIESPPADCTGLPLRQLPTEDFQSYTACLAQADLLEEVCHAK
jgi:transposase